MKRLTIISHTEHYTHNDGHIVGLASTVTEINHLLNVFDEIFHVAMHHDSVPPANTLPYLSDAITFVPIPAVGGLGLSNKLAIAKQIPSTLRIINKCLKSSDYFQFRAPTGIGVYVIPYLIFFESTKGWFKYAGNWKQLHAPAAYRFQKWLLEHQSRKVTINGFWEDQPQHCLSFENPCLTLEEINDGQLFREKEAGGPMDFCFVGRLESSKGIDLLIDAMNSLEAVEKSKIGTIHLVGDGEKLQVYKQQVLGSDLNFVFHGFLSRKEVHNIYKRSHAILLPSASEGFPKVIAEAMNYGCVPIVSNVSSIGHYIKNGINGFLLDDINLKSLRKCIISFLNQVENENIETKNDKELFLKKFTFDNYNERLLNDIV